MVRAVKLAHPSRLSNNFKLYPLPDSVFNSGGDKGKYKFIEDKSGQFFSFSFYCGGCFKEILAFLLVSLYLALLLDLCCVILVLICNQRRADH